VQNIILCPKCRIQIKRDNYGELICPNCNARYCPKCHNPFERKICASCGWEDPNFSLYIKAQQARHQKREQITEDTYQTRQYICPQCGARVDTTREHCNFCGQSHARSMAAKPAPAGPLPIASQAIKQSKPIWDSVPREPRPKKIREPKSTFVRERQGPVGTHFQFPPLKQFVRPILASTLAGLIIVGLVFGGIYAYRFIREEIKSGALPPVVVVTPTKTYTLATNVVPQSAGEIRITPPPSANGTYESGSQVNLTAIPGDCYIFNYWDGVASPTDNITITMDSDVTLTANFKNIDSTEPIISQVKLDSYSDVSATISWVTDIPATSKVDYGETNDYGFTAVSNGELTTNHKVRVTGLKPNTIYYFMVKSADKCGAEASETKMIATAQEITYGEKVGRRAIDFTLPYYYDDNPESPNKSGSETLSAYIGKKKILLNFWSTYCGACIGEFPYIRDIYEDADFADSNSANSDFLVLTICIDSKINEAPARIETIEAKFIDEAGPFTLPILMDSVGQTKKDYHVWTIPETVFIDSDGIIRNIKIGRFKDIEEIKTILNSLN